MEMQKSITLYGAGMAFVLALVAAGGALAAAEQRLLPVFELGPSAKNG